MTSKRYVLDTCALLALIRGGPLGAKTDSLFGLAASSERQIVSIVTHAELRVIAERNGWGTKKQEALTTGLREVVTVDVRSETLIAAYTTLTLTISQVCTSIFVSLAARSKVRGPSRHCLLSRRPLYPRLTLHAKEVTDP